MGLFDAITGILGGGTPQAAPVTNPFGNIDQSTALDSARSTNNIALQNQQSLLNQLNPYAQQGLGTQSNVLQQQQQLAQALQMQAQGQGPNPAQAQLAQNTAANTANQAALMAGQRGSGANAGLLARQIGQQGAATQQASVGQAATLQAQQQIAAQQQLAQQQQAMQQAATQQVGQYQNQISNYGNQTLGAQNSAYGAIGAANQQAGANQASVNQGNSAITGAILGGLGGAFNGLGAAAMQGGGSKSASANSTGFGSAGGNVNSFAQYAAHGGMIMDEHHKAVAQIFHPELFKENKKTEQVPQEDRFSYGGTANMKSGGKVAGKAKVSGDSPKNDTVPAMLSPGEVVIPKSVMESADPVKEAAAFVAQELSKQKSPEHGDFKLALKKAIGGRKSKK